MKNWPYGDPVKGDISEFRLVRMEFCRGADDNDCSDDGGHVFLTSCGVTRCIYCKKSVA
jgi:hypothetical protein